MSRSVLFSGVLVDVADVVDGAAKGVQQCRTAPGRVIPVRHGLNTVDGYPVMQYLALAVKEDGRDQCLPRLPPLLGNHGVKAADGVGLQPGHRAAAVQDKYNLGQILLHKKPPVILVPEYTKIIGGFSFGSVKVYAQI